LGLVVETKPRLTAAIDRENLQPTTNSRAGSVSPEVTGEGPREKAAPGGSVLEAPNLAPTGTPAENAAWFTRTGHR